MNAAEMWGEYILLHPEYKDCRYEAWSYGSVPDELAELTRKGIKTATASALPAYRHENEPLPKADAHNVILDSQDRAVCIIKNIAVSVVPFSEVSSRHAYLEGEGDRSLEYWRSVHAEVFAMELNSFGEEFNENMPVVCEEFEMVYPLNS